MMKFFLIALSLTAVLAQDAEDMSIDSLLEESADAELPCTIKPCFPVCKAQTLYISFGAFKIPYQKNVCAPLASCLNANKACQALLIKTIQQAQAQEKLVKSSYSAAKMAHANHAKKAAAAKAATEEAAKAAKAMDAAKSWSAAKTAQYGAAVREYNQAKATMDAKKKTMDTAVKQYQKTKTDHLDAVAAMHRANSAAAKALADFKAKAKAHCDSEALHAQLVHSLGHAQLATKNCQKFGVGAEVGGWRKSGTGGFDGWTNFNMVFPQDKFKFKSGGQVCSWKMHKGRSSGVKMQVYRGSGSTFKLIGSNTITSTSTGTAYVYHVPANQRITVNAGDYIGLRFMSPATIPFTGGGATRWGSGPGHPEVKVGHSYRFPGAGGRQYAVTAIMC
jgi:hypothetical protein